MSRVFSSWGRRLANAAKLGAGASLAGAAVFHLQTRNCRFAHFTPDSDRDFFRHPLFQQTNPWSKPYSADACVREIPFEKLDPQLVEDWKTGGTQLIERFTQGLWGGAGYAIQRRLMRLTLSDQNKDDVWFKDDILKCPFEPGTYVTNHFRIISKSPQSIFMRGCFDPHEDPPTPKNVDNVVEIKVVLDEDKKVASLSLRVATFDGTETASTAEDPFGGFGGWLHRRYSTALVESGARNCMI